MSESGLFTYFYFLLDYMDLEKVKLHFAYYSITRTLAQRRLACSRY